MPYEKRKRAQSSKKRKVQKQQERAPQRRSGETAEPTAGKPAQPGPARQPGSSVQTASSDQAEVRAARRRPGEGLDKSDEGVIAGTRLAGRRFTG